MSTRKRKIKKKYSFLEIWERVKKNTPVENFNQLAEIVGTSVSNVTKRKNEDNFPIEWAFHVAQQYKFSTEWLLTGEDSAKIANFTQSSKFEILNKIEAWLDEITRKEPYRKEWFQAEIEDKFPAFKKWEKEKEGVSGPEEEFLPKISAAGGGGK